MGCKINVNATHYMYSPRLDPFPHASVSGIRISIATALYDNTRIIGNTDSMKPMLCGLEGIVSHQPPS